MSTKGNGSIEDGNTQHHSTRSAPLTWSFNQNREHGVVLGPSPVTDQAPKDSTEKNSDKDVVPCGCSLASSREEETKMEDTEMLNVPNAASRSSSNGTSMGSTIGQASLLSGGPIIFVDADGDVLEMTRATPSNAAFEVPNAHQAQTLPIIRSNSRRPSHLGQSAIGVLDSRAVHHGCTQRRGEVDQKQGTTVAPHSAQPPSEEPDVQILDATVARLFPIYRKASDHGKLQICPGDYLDDAAFAQYLKQTAPSSKQEINEDDEAAAEDFAEEDFIVDHLQSLVLSRPEISLPIRQRRTLGQQESQVVAFKPKDLDLRIGVTVELHNGSFIWIDSVKRTFGGLRTIKGYKLVRDGYCGSRLPDDRVNELVWINEVDEEGYRAGLESVLQEEQASNVKRVREVVYTNRPWPKVSFGSEYQNKGMTKGDVNVATVQEQGKLYCRWKYVQVNSRLTTDTEACFTLLNDNEAHGIGRFAASVVRKKWRGGKCPIPGGSSTKPVVDVETGKTTSFLRQYTLGDCFCGAGGISRGATQAGLQVAWGFDKDPDAIEVHHKNFARHGTKSLAMNDAEFIDLMECRPGEYEVDIAHYSPPCQPFSSANHNKNEERDFMNQKALFSLLHLTEHLRPRIATIEETAGLMHRHKQWFDTLINIFTTIGYSVRWKIVRCQDYGIPQSRIRLLLIAAAPGEKLPKIVERTHGEAGSGLRPYITIRDVIYQIPRCATHQNMRPESRNPELLTPYPADSLAKCITTGGGQNNHHPSGYRKYSVREMACLQGFPTDHHFHMHKIGVAMKQVGNAVPPTLAKPWFAEIIKSLKETDGLYI